MLDKVEDWLGTVQACLDSGRGLTSASLLLAFAVEIMIKYHIMSCGEVPERTNQISELIKQLRKKDRPVPNVIYSKKEILSRWMSDGRYNTKFKPEIEDIKILYESSISYYKYLLTIEEVVE